MKHPLENSRGFTLVELIVAMAISIVIMAGIYSVYISQTGTAVTQQKIVEMQSNVRWALSYLEKSIRMAGYDPTKMAGTGFVEDFPTLDDPGVSTGASSIAFTMDDDEDGNLDANRDEYIAFRLSGGQLQRYTNTGGAVDWTPIASNIDALNFIYLGDASPPNVLAIPLADLTAIRSVQVTVVARVEKTTPLRYTDTTSYRNQQGDEILAPQNDGFRRRLLTAEIKVRNIGLD